ncbi:hypothetical protein [Pseudomonas abietaniphila]|uniref:Uncharacterized protein n=1 Tax=Pseudomonas abietaniphila TaxID=89065 RepID=A0A1G8QUE4_9PSED|nr:hypothetical protein [Pseudomonas abietaniphila]SDJ08308.1 hypothetical protein SAMN05216605_12166 [Pseudomonas abietaniphila]
MKFQPAFERMQAIVEAENCLLKAYKVDFYQYDREHLANTGTVGGRYVWVIRQNGTHLASLNLHHKVTQFVECALASNEALEVYEITLLEDGDATINSITVAKAHDLIQVQPFEFQGRHIKKNGRLIALVDIKTIFHQGKHGGSVNFTFEQPPSPDVETNFKQVALCLFQQKVQTLFASMDEVTFSTQRLS